jgi:hypothetical protein
MKNKKVIFLFLNGFWAETELGPCAQRALGLLWPDHSAKQARAARPNTGQADRRTRPTFARARRGTLRACAMARLATARRWPNLCKVYTASFPSPRCTRLTRLRAPARSEEDEQRRGETHRRGRRCRSSTVVKVSPSWFGK